MKIICQSCGMPITIDAVLGTEKNGEFIDKVDMQTYIEMCSQFGSQARMTNEEMKVFCEKLFPTLKRWKKD